MTTKAKNLIWFVVDQMRGQAVGINGDPNVFTPNLDNLAIAGRNFTQAVSGYPLCCPFRGSMMTSKYAHNHSIKLHEERLDPELPLVNDVFKEQGYETIYLGKWHMAGMKERDGRTVTRTVPKIDRGRFDTWLGYENNNSQWDCYLHGHDGDEDVPHYKMPGYETDHLTDLAIERITSRTDEDAPFFMVVSVQPPHVPGLAPADNRRYQAQQLKLRDNVPASEEANTRIGLSSYYAQIENIDDNVGRVMQTLREQNLIDDTYLMFFSDHGDQLGSQGRFGKCVPYEESLRVPFIVGGGVPRCQQGQGTWNSDCLINHVDIGPTSLGLCDIAVPEWMEGYDYSHQCSDNNTPRAAQARFDAEPDAAYAQLIGDRESSYAWRCVVTRDGWKYACVDGGEWMMFNLKEDPFEQNNLAFHTKYKNKRSEMNQLIRKWADQTGDAFDFPG